MFCITFKDGVKIELAGSITLVEVFWGPYFAPINATFSNIFYKSSPLYCDKISDTKDVP
jgi:hypothetical protein